MLGECRKYDVVGEVRAVQLRSYDSAHSFSIMLANADHLGPIQLNEKLLQKTAGAHTYQANLPISEPRPPKPVPLTLLRYRVATNYRPFPVRVVPRWTFDQGCDRLEVTT